MRRLRLFSYDDVDCARSARGKGATAFYKLILLAHKNDNQFASIAAQFHPLWSKHCKRLAAMRQSGKLDRIQRDRANSSSFFRDYELRKYEEWREDQRFILQAMDEPMPAWLRTPDNDTSPRRGLDRV